MVSVIMCTLCDEFGFNAGLPKKVFFDNKVGWEGLWEEIQKGLQEDLFETSNLEELRTLVLTGRIKEAQKYLRYASLTAVPAVG